MPALPRANELDFDESYAVTLRLRVLDTLGNETETRKGIFVHSDTTLRPGFPIDLGTSLDSAAVMADLDGNGAQEVVVAGSDGQVHALQADGSAMYTIQSLWTQAREGLDVTTVILNNRAYAILSLELGRVGARTDGTAADLFDLSRPPLDFAALARGMGLPARTVRTADGLVGALDEAYAEPGPHLIDAVLP